MSNPAAERIFTDLERCHFSDDEKEIIARIIKLDSAAQQVVMTRLVNMLKYFQRTKCGVVPKTRKKLDAVLADAAKMLGDNNQ